MVKTSKNHQKPLPQSSSPFRGPVPRPGCASQFHTFGALPSNGTSSAGQRCARCARRSRDRKTAVADAMGTAWGPGEPGAVVVLGGVNH